ncbi:MAG: hypothetical protein ACMG6E_02965, partial [Candidatus Roizmanbacteria bacterium]
PSIPQPVVENNDDKMQQLRQDIQDATPPSSGGSFHIDQKEDNQAETQGTEIKVQPTQELTTETQEVQIPQESTTEVTQAPTDWLKPKVFQGKSLI